MNWAYESVSSALPLGDYIGLNNRRFNLLQGALVQAPVDLKIYDVARYSSIQAAHDAMPSTGGILYISKAYTITAKVNITKPVRVAGGGSITQMTANTNVFYVTSSNFAIDPGLMLSCPAGSSSDRNGAAVRVVGTPGSFLSNISIDGLTSTGGSYGVLLQYVDGFKVERTKLSSIYYGGVYCESVTNGAVSRNEISSITGSLADNAYGIAITRSAGGSDPISSHVRIEDNCIKSVTNWAGIDTHAGQYILVSGNDVSDVHWGILFGPDSDGNAPKWCHGWGNTVRAAGNASPASAARITGASGARAVDCSLTDNLFDGFGTSGASTGASVEVSYADDPVVNGNRIRNSISGAISFYGTVNDAAACYNRIRSIDTSSGSFNAAIKIASGTVTGVAKYNQMTLGSTTAFKTYAAMASFYVGSTAPRSNHIDTSGTIFDPGAASFGD